MKPVTPPLLFSLLSLASACSGGSGSSAPPDNGGGPGPGSGVVVEDVTSFAFTGAKTILFIPAEFEDQPALVGLAQLQDFRDGLIEAFDKSSYGALSLSVDIAWPPVLIPKEIGEYGPEDALVRVRADALQAARDAGWAPEQYDREVLFCYGVWNTGARGWIRTVWMPHTLETVIHHEVGHTLGWGHADFWLGDPVGFGTAVNRGDIYDTMGDGLDYTTFRYPAPLYRLRAGWLDPSQIELVETSGSYTITSLENPDPSEGPVALVVRRDEDYDYWIFRRAEVPLVRDGVLIVRVQSNPFIGNPLLDMNPGAGGSVEAEDAALRQGMVFDDTANSGVTITNATVPGGPITLDVVVDEARQAALDVRPLIQVLGPPQDEGPLSGVVDFTVAVADPTVGVTDGEGIAKVTLEVLSTGMEPFPTVASTELFQAPYLWSFDTTILRDANFYLAVTAEGTDGGTRTIWFRFLVDNAVPGS